jgi:hypothetical protein
MNTSHDTQLFHWHWTVPVFDKNMPEDGLKYQQHLISAFFM